MKLTNMVVSFQVKDLAKASNWYNTWVEGTPVSPINDIVELKIMENNWIQLYTMEKDTVERSSIVLGVEDIEAAKTYLNEKGIETGEIIDLDGNSISFAEEI